MGCHSTGWLNSIFRSIPLLALLIFLYYGLGRVAVQFGSSGFWLVVPGLTLSESAYLGEVYRGGLLAIPQSQWGAAASLGLGWPSIIWRVVLPQAGYLAALTKKVRFVTSTIVLPHHHPVLLNRQLATLDELSDGRITLGIGLGGSAEEYRRMRGDLGAANRGRMMDVFVEALRVLWRDDKASFAGRYVKFDDLQCFPKPAQQPLPIFMAGEAEGALRRLARFGNGWIDTFFPPDAMREKIGQIYGYIREARGGDVPIEITRQFYISLADTPAADDANMKASLPHARPTQPARRRAGMETNLVGTPPMIAAPLKEYAAAGVTEICAIFYSPDAKGALRQMEAFAGEVIPAVVSGA